MTRTNRNVLTTPPVLAAPLAIGADTATLATDPGVEMSETGLFSIVIGDERIDVGARAGVNLTGLVRACDETTEADHAAGASVVQVIARADYEAFQQYGFAPPTFHENFNDTCTSPNYVARNGNTSLNLPPWTEAGQRQQVTAVTGLTEGIVWVSAQPGENIVRRDGQLAPYVALGDDFSTVMFESAESPGYWFIVHESHPIAPYVTLDSGAGLYTIGPGVKTAYWVGGDATGTSDALRMIPVEIEGQICRFSNIGTGAMQVSTAPVSDAIQEIAIYGSYQQVPFTINGVTITSFLSGQSAAQLGNQLDYQVGVAAGFPSGYPAGTFGVTRSGTGGVADPYIYRITWGGELSHMDFDTGPQPLITSPYEGHASTNEQQRITITGGPTGGFWTATSGTTTANLARNISAAALQTALNALSGITDVSVTRSGAGTLASPYVWNIYFNQATSQYNPQNQITVTNVSLSGGTAPAVTSSTIVEGDLKVEVTEIAAASNQTVDGVEWWRHLIAPGVFQTIAEVGGEWRSVEAGNTA